MDTFGVWYKAEKGGLDRQKTAIETKNLTKVKKFMNPLAAEAGIYKSTCKIKKIIE